MSNNIFRKMPLDMILSQKKEGPKLKRVYGALELIMMGVGVVIGTGIFVVTGVAAADYAGPALILSFILAGIACGCAALCYSELAAMIPVSGSSYTFCYVGLGEVWGWFTAWCLVLEYIVALSAIATGWSAYADSFLQVIGTNLPQALTAGALAGGAINLPAIFIVSLMALLVIAGARESAWVNNILVVVKICVIILFLVLGFRHVNIANFTPFMPYGWNGVFGGAAIVFFAYLGFDAIPNAAEEVKNPAKDLPRGIIGALIIVTICYITVTFVLTGMLPYAAYHGVASPVAYALMQAGINWGSALISVGALTGLTSGVLVMTYASSRLLYAISRDGLIPEIFSQLREKAATPSKAALIVWISAFLISGFAPIGAIVEMVNMGTLFAFMLVSLTVIVMRKSYADRHRDFKVPFVPVIPIIAIVICAFFVYHLGTPTKIMFSCWVIIGLAIYFTYGRIHSNLAEGRQAPIDK